MNEYEELKAKYTEMLKRDNYHEVVYRICLCCKHCQGDETVSGLSCSKYTMQNVVDIQYNGTCDNWEQSRFYSR